MKISIVHHHQVVTKRHLHALKAASIFLVMLVCPPALQCQNDTSIAPGRDSSSSNDKVNGARLAIVGGVTAGAITAIHLYQLNAWWKGARSKFHVREDLVYAKNVDKLGHMYAGNLLTFTFSRSLQWSNVAERPSIVWGAVGSTLFETYIEVEDGFSKYWGFDRVDFAGDLFGAWYPVAQEFVPFLRNFNFKFSYYPIKSGSPSAISGQTYTIFDDYEGQTMWLSMRMKELLPRSVASYWPRFLCLSVGVSVRNNESPNRYLVVFLAPDLDMTHIIPPDTGFLKTLGETLNFIHFPMPAVRISPKVAWYGLYF
jgi:hypothetical protein